MKRIRVVLCVVLVMAMLAMSAGPAAAGSKPTSVIESSGLKNGYNGSGYFSESDGSGSVGVQGLKNGYGGYGG
jgi:hypothetical protein